jgi:quercetin dioxygenase-like cupin family protein
VLTLRPWSKYRGVDVAYVRAMNIQMLVRFLSAAGCAMAVAVCAAQSAAATRKELRRVELAIPGRDAVMVLAEIPPGTASVRHSHPGDDLGYVVEGTIVLQVDGQPPLTLHAGDVFTTPPGRVHNARNVGTTMARALDTYMVERGQAAVIPAASR